MSEVELYFCHINGYLVTGLFKDQIITRLLVIDQLTKRTHLVNLAEGVKTPDPAINGCVCKLVAHGKVTGEDFTQIITERLGCDIIDTNQHGNCYHADDLSSVIITHTNFDNRSLYILDGELNIRTTVTLTNGVVSFNADSIVHNPMDIAISLMLIPSNKEHFNDQAVVMDALSNFFNAIIPAVHDFVDNMEREKRE